MTCVYVHLNTSEQSRSFYNCSLVHMWPTMAANIYTVGCSVKTIMLTFSPSYISVSWPWVSNTACSGDLYNTYKQFHFLLNSMWTWYLKSLEAVYIMRHETTWWDVMMWQEDWRWVWFLTDDDASSSKTVIIWFHSYRHLYTACRHNYTYAELLYVVLLISSHCLLLAMSRDTGSS